MFSLPAQTQRSLNRVRMLLEQQGGKCALCGQFARPEECNIDHIIPRSKGGLTEPGNIQATHTTCNFAKGDLASRGETDRDRIAMNRRRRRHGQFSRRDERRELVARVLCEAFPKPLTISAIADQANISLDDVSFAIERLARHGRVKQVRRHEWIANE